MIEIHCTHSTIEKMKRTFPNEKVGSAIKTGRWVCGAAITIAMLAMQLLNPRWPTYTRRSGRYIPLTKHVPATQGMSTMCRVGI